MPKLLGEHSEILFAGHFIIIPRGMLGRPAAYLHRQTDSDTNRKMTNKALKAPALSEIQAAATALAPFVIRSPLMPLQHDGRSGDIFLKLENLQAIGAFKCRPMGNVLLNADSAQLQKGVYTASSGNAGLGLAWMARELGLAATVYAPESAPPDKLAAIRALGAQVRTLPDNQWWQIIEGCGNPDDSGLYVDAVRDPAAQSGNGTIGLEIFDQAPDVDTVIVPFGGGGLSCGIAAAMRALQPDTRIIVAESDAATPLTAAMQAGRPVPVEHKPSFISGAGAVSVLEEMWPLVSELVDDTVVVTVADVAAAVKLLFERNKIVAEGAGAIALAAALANEGAYGKSVCIVSGGNIDPAGMTAILKRD
jgi:threonine dehydratase